MENKQRLHSYGAYGVNFGSALPLPELVATEGEADVVLHIGKVQPLPSVIDETGHGFWATRDEACHFVQGVGAFLIRKGREVIIDPAPGVEERVLRLSILGPVLTLLLHQRGSFVLHASAIEVAGQAIAFMGGPGWGKSTQAAILESRGYGIVADDATAIDMNGNGCKVIPGFPWLKLWPDAILTLGEKPESMTQLHPLLEKRGRRAAHEFSQKPLPLRRIYLLAVDSSPAIEPCNPQEALTGIMRHWKGSQFGPDLLRSSDLSSFFLQCANLANKVAVYRLKRPASLAALPEVADLVEEHLAAEE